MKKPCLKQAVIMAAVSAMVGFAHASAPKTIEITPLRDPALFVAPGQVQSLQYQVVNHGDTARTLVMKPVQGVSQQYDQKNACPEYMQLAPGASCTLDLRIEAQHAVYQQSMGPTLCNDGITGKLKENLQSGTCVQPEQDARISLKKQTQNTPGISVKVILPKGSELDKATLGHQDFCYSSYASCGLTLLANGGQGSLVIYNTTSNVWHNITATLPWGDVTQDATNCATLPAQGQCTLYFTPGTAAHANTTVSIQGSDTPGATSVSMRVLGLGSFYQNGFLVYINAGTNTGMLVAPFDTAGDSSVLRGLPWDPSFSPVFISGITTNGLTNTQLIINQLTGVQQLNRLSYAAGACYTNVSGVGECTGGSDCWYLPSLEEADTVAVVMDTLVNAGIGNPFQVSFNASYWTSSQNTATTAVSAVYNIDGNTDSAKGNFFNLRCVRQFS